MPPRYRPEVICPPCPVHRVGGTLSRVPDRRIKEPSSHNPTLPQPNGAQMLGDLISGNLLREGDQHG
jgi:hypothetical protein